MTLQTYDPKEVAIIFGHLISGFADGTFVNVEFNEDAFVLSTGTDGEGCRSKTNNGSAIITFTLGQWSKSNPILSALHQVDLNTPNGDGIVPFLIKDNTGSSLGGAEKAWIKKLPNLEFAKTPGNRVWVLETNNAQVFVGSNA